MREKLFDKLSNNFQKDKRKKDFNLLLRNPAKIDN